MADIQVKTADDIRKLFESRTVSHVQIGITDHTGQLRGKYISKDKFLKALDGGIAMTRNFAAVDFNDIIYSIEGLTHNGGGFGDALARIVPESCREIPWEAPDRNLFFLIEHQDEAAVYDARRLCQSQIDKAAGMGFKVYFSGEFEFRVFNETPASLQAKGYRDLELITPVSNYLGVLRQTAFSDFFGELTAAVEHMGIPVEVAHWELAAGFAEIVLHYDEGMRAADNAVLFKTFAKAFALRQDRLISFMARYDASSDGSSCHLHTSLRGTDGSFVFHDPGKPNGISDTMRHFIAGIERLKPELLLMMAPNINSFKRYIPGLFAPVASSWGVDNRTTSLRAIIGSPGAQRVENRVPGADCNPYLAVSAMLAAGLWGIEQKLEPNPEVTDNLYDHIETIAPEFRFPATFDQAIERFRNSDFAKNHFGEEFVRIYSANREEHAAEFRRAVTDWELRRYLELT